MEDSTVEQFSEFPPFFEFNFWLMTIGVITILVLIPYWLKKGGIKELAENLLLSFLLFFAAIMLGTYPVTESDEITAGLLFVAFGVCRIAKNMANKQ